MKYGLKNDFNLILAPQHFYDHGKHYVFTFSYEEASVYIVHKDGVSTILIKSDKPLREHLHMFKDLFSGTSIQVCELEDVGVVQMTGSYGY